MCLKRAWKKSGDTRTTAAHSAKMHSPHVHVVASIDSPICCMLTCMCTVILCVYAYMHAYAPDLCTRVRACTQGCDDPERRWGVPSTRVRPPQHCVAPNECPFANGLHHHTCVVTWRHAVNQFKVFCFACWPWPTAVDTRSACTYVRARAAILFPLTTLVQHSLSSQSDQRTARARSTGFDNRFRLRGLRVAQPWDPNVRPLWRAFTIPCAQQHIGWPRNIVTGLPWFQLPGVSCI